MTKSFCTQPGRDLQLCDSLVICTALKIISLHLDPWDRGTIIPWAHFLGYAAAGLKEVHVRVSDYHFNQLRPGQAGRLENEVLLQEVTKPLVRKATRDIVEMEACVFRTGPERPDNDVC